MFLQDPPRLGNRLAADPALLGALRRLLPPDVWASVRDDLIRLGARVEDEFAPLQLEAEARPPEHVPFDAWGRRVDRIQPAAAWLQLLRIGTEIGLVAAPYELPGPAGRVLQAGLIQLFQPVAAMSTCPMAMSDGAAQVLLAHDPELAARYVPRLTRRADAWTSGQWMTETPGGSDVSRTEVVARPAGDGTWTLHGTKWFTSATTADIALVLARPQDAAGLSLFLVELRRPDGSWNALQARRLKDKMGTRALPTAELDLLGTTAVPVGDLGRGVAKVATMLNVTRLWAAYGAVGPAGHLLALARDYARRREAFGHKLSDLPIHTYWMADLAATYEAIVALSFQAAWFVGASATGDADPALARVITPLTKLACARQGLEVCSELLESFGGAGYLEDTGIPVIFRDAHVQSIWEGTSSVMAHDLLRALGKSGAREALHDDIGQRIARSDHPGLAETVARVTAAAARLRELTAAADESTARPLAWSLARTYEAVLLCEAASADHGNSRLAMAAAFFGRRPLITEADPAGSLRELAFAGDSEVMDHTIDG